MKKLPVSPRIKFARAVVIIGIATLCILAVWMIWCGPTQEQLGYAPTWGLQQ